MATDRADWAWAAGLYEGEGTIARCPRTVSMTITMTDREPLDKFHAIVGVGTLRGPYYYENRVSEGEAKARWTWRVYGRRKCLELIGMFAENLSTRRTEQAVDVLHR